MGVFPDGMFADLFQSGRGALEEIEDIAAFDEAMAEEGPSIPWERVKADLGWQ